MISRRRQQWSWSMYDWANSTFATTVIAGFFPVFFNQYWAEGIAPQTQTFYLGVAGSVSSLIVMLMSPYLGAVADQRGWKKRLLFAFTLLGVFATAGLYFVGRGEAAWAIVLFTVGSIGFFGGLTFYDSLLVHVARPEESDRVSALGFGLGYLGGGLLFAVNVAMALRPDLFGIPDAAMGIRLSFLMVAVWWLLFSLPLFRDVSEGPVSAMPTPGWKELWDTLRAIRGMRQIWLFLLAYWLYIDGVHTIIRMAVDFGMKLGFEPDSLIVALLLVQFIGFPAAIVFGWLGDRIGTQRAIFIALAAYAGVTAWAYFLETVVQFYMMAVAIALVQGGVQSLSRSFYSRLIPPEKSGEFFGFYNMIGKFAAVLGPMVVGVTAQLTGDPRLSILGLIVFFIGGGILLAMVREGPARPLEARA
jgi:MFS transporter, UMF1 family